MSANTASVVILTWNSREVVNEAIDSALAQTVSPAEVLVFDNASQDGTPQAIARRFGSQVRLVCAAHNHGYCGGYNRALAIAGGEFALLLNPDARLAPSFLAEALPAFRDERVGIIAPRLVRPGGEVIDSSGQFLARSRKTLDRGYGKRFDPRRDRAGAVLSACGAAALYRRAMIEDIADDGELFDEAFFAYHEDLEVGWRAWRAGWKAVHVPEAVAVHQRSSGDHGGATGMTFSKPPWLRAHIVKNRVLTSLRHDSLGAVLLDLPWIVMRDALIYGGLLVKSPAAYRELWRHRSAFGRSWGRRTLDAKRKGCWGAWRRETPRRGLW
ncbi:MAG: glycosyltransferase family 2 protein [Acidobacteriota bacterium]